MLPPLTGECAAHAVPVVKFPPPEPTDCPFHVGRTRIGLLKNALKSELVSLPEELKANVRKRSMLVPPVALISEPVNVCEVIPVPEMVNVYPVALVWVNSVCRPSPENPWVVVVVPLLSE